MYMDNVGNILLMSVRGQGVRRLAIGTLSTWLVLAKEQGVKNVGMKDSEITEGFCLQNGLGKQNLFF